ncbi:MAG: hypothetical protein LBT59_04030 [Clostridiales bacterium]|jgi:hypothetical protein|nr:hypothetical protein [Clostridiales bacterium]
MATKKSFNTEGTCIPEKHYMVKNEGKLQEILSTIRDNKYIVLNRPRQTGKTTTLHLMKRYIMPDYAYVYISLEDIEDELFLSTQEFCSALADVFIYTIQHGNTGISVEALEEFKNVHAQKNTLLNFITALSSMCRINDKRIVLAIDEIDIASDNAPFLRFLGALRNDYNQGNPMFQSVILAGVSDIRNLKSRIQNDEKTTKNNSLWNIAVNTSVNLFFSSDDIYAMLEDYRTERNISMDSRLISNLMMTQTSGYPFLVSKLCWLIDCKVSNSAEFSSKQSAWTQDGFLMALRLLNIERMQLPVFQSLKNQLEDNSKLYESLKNMLLLGTNYSIDESISEQAIMHGFLKKDEQDNLHVTNVIFETFLYNIFINEQMSNIDPTQLIFESSDLKGSFFKARKFDADLVLAKFSSSYNKIFPDELKPEMEKLASFIFLMFIHNIVNGIGNYYIAPQTRDRKRLDVVIDYFGNQTVIELKIWHGKSQLAYYLDTFNLDTGYLLVFSNLKTKDVKGRFEDYINNKKIISYIV